MGISREKRLEIWRGEDKIFVLTHNTARTGEHRGVGSIRYSHRGSEKQNVEGGDKEADDHPRDIQHRAELRARLEYHHKDIHGWDEREVPVIQGRTPFGVCKCQHLTRNAYRSTTGTTSLSLSLSLSPLHSFIFILSRNLRN